MSGIGGNEGESPGREPRRGWGRPPRRGRGSRRGKRGRSSGHEELETLSSPASVPVSTNALAGEKEEEEEKEERMARVSPVPPTQLDGESEAGPSKPENGNGTEASRKPSSDALLPAPPLKPPRKVYIPEPPAPPPLDPSTPITIQIPQKDGEESGSGSNTRSSGPSPSIYSSPAGKPGYIHSPSLRLGGGGDPGSAKFTTRQWTTLMVFGVADLFSAMVLSLQAPFYPPEAEAKGATPSEYGLVFGVYELVVFLMSPLFGKYIGRLGPRAVFNCGVVLTATACIAFGLLHLIEGHVEFITLSFLLRILEAVGAAAFVTSSFTIIAIEFPGNVATTFASLETFFGLGLIVGPTVGGALFQLGGFVLPFAVVGACLLLTAVAAMFVMPVNMSSRAEQGEESGEEEGSGLFKILLIPGVALCFLSLVMTANAIGFLSATLEPHLRPFNLTPLQTGAMFIIYGGVYAFTAPPFGWICDRMEKPIYLLGAGAIVNIVAFLLIGPAPFLQGLETRVWLTAVGLFILGLGLSSTLVSGFISAIGETTDAGHPDDLNTYGMISGLWTSAVSLGSFLGPSVGGVLFEQVGFRDGTYYIFACEFLVLLMTLLYMIRGKPGSRTAAASERTPILGRKDRKERSGLLASVSYGSDQGLFPEDPDL